MDREGKEPELHGDGEKCQVTHDSVSDALFVTATTGRGSTFDNSERARVSSTSTPGSSGGGGGGSGVNAMAIGNLVQSSSSVVAIILEDERVEIIIPLSVTPVLQCIAYTTETTLFCVSVQRPWSAH